jgi:hypothetical protein
MTEHYHCPAAGCYWRIQYVTTCSRCGSRTVQREGCCGLSAQPAGHVTARGYWHPGALRSCGRSECASLPGQPGAEKEPPNHPHRAGTGEPTGSWA